MYRIRGRELKGSVLHLAFFSPENCCLNVVKCIVVFHFLVQANYLFSHHFPTDSVQVWHGITLHLLAVVAFFLLS